MKEIEDKKRELENVKPIDSERCNDMVKKWHKLESLFFEKKISKNEFDRRVTPLEKELEKSVIYFDSDAQFVKFMRFSGIFHPTDIVGTINHELEHASPLKNKGYEYVFGIRKIIRDGSIEYQPFVHIKDEKFQKLSVGKALKVKKEVLDSVSKMSEGDKKQYESIKNTLGDDNKSCF